MSTNTLGVKRGMIPRTIIDKIWDEHVVSQKDGHPAIFGIDFVLIHEVTSAQAFDMLRAKGLQVFKPSRIIATLDHSVPTRKNRDEILDAAARAQVEALRRNCNEFGIRLCDYNSGHQGVVHVIGPELGLAQPGMTIVCGDSHTATLGAFGSLAFGIGTSELGHVFVSGCLLQRKAKTMRVEFKGHLRKGVFAKDLILKLIASIGIGGANGHIIEYTGQVIREMSMEERMTICNMSIECGARAGLIAPDDTTFAYLKDKELSPKGHKWSEALDYWKSLCSDSEVKFDKYVEIDIESLGPMVTWGINPEQSICINERIPDIEKLKASERESAAKALNYTKLSSGEPIEGVPIDWAFLGSCTNGRIEDLRIAAGILKGQKIKPGLTFYVVPGSEAVMEQAEAEGLKDVFVEAGADFRMPGCSLCLGMNDDKVPAGKRCISSSNRNFIGRQGTGSITHLASPATVAASAIAGCISSPEKYFF